MGKPFKHIENSKGSGIDPCGIPDFTIDGFDRLLSYSTFVFLFGK